MYHFTKPFPFCQYISQFTERKTLIPTISPFIPPTHFHSPYPPSRLHTHLHLHPSEYDSDRLRSIKNTPYNSAYQHINTLFTLPLHQQQSQHRYHSLSIPAIPDPIHTLTSSLYSHTLTMPKRIPQKHAAKTNDKQSKQSKSISTTDPSEVAADNRSNSDDFIDTLEQYKRIPSTGMNDMTHASDTKILSMSKNASKAKITHKHFKRQLHTSAVAPRTKSGDSTNGIVIYEKVSIDVDSSDVVLNRVMSENDSEKEKSTTTSALKDQFNEAEGMTSASKRGRRRRSKHHMIGTTAAECIAQVKDDQEENGNLIADQTITVKRKQSTKRMKATSRRSFSTAAASATVSASTAATHRTPPKAARSTKKSIRATKSVQQVEEADDAVEDVSATAAVGKKSKAKSKAKRKRSNTTADDHVDVAIEMEEEVDEMDVEIHGEGTPLKGTKAKKQKRVSSPTTKNSAKAIRHLIEHIDEHYFKLPWLHSKKRVGAHISMSGGHVNAVYRAAYEGMTAFAMDTKSKRQWNKPELSDDQCAAFREALKKYQFNPKHILPHGSYLMNCGSKDSGTLDKSRDCLIDEMMRCYRLGIPNYNFHPGSTCGGDKDECIAMIAESINLAHKEVPETVAVLENMAGSGSAIGQSFEELKAIIDLVHDQTRVGVCLDTCHAYAAGYDISTAAGVGKFLNEFHEKIGLHYLKGMHINDSKAPLGSKKDRHENLGDGEIKLECFRAIMNDPRLDDIPLILETPVNPVQPSTLDAAEVKLLYSMIEQEESAESNGGLSSSAAASCAAASSSENGVTM